MKQNALFSSQRNTPNPKIPWCPSCKLHTEYHLKTSGNSEQQASFYTCNDCGGATWKLTNPWPLNLVSLQLVCPIVFGFMPYVVKNEGLRGLVSIPITACLVWVLYQNCKSNNKHWREFRAWARSTRNAS
jgi:hypothetical protein